MVNMKSLCVLHKQIIQTCWNMEWKTYRWNQVKMVNRNCCYLNANAVEYCQTNEQVSNARLLKIQCQKKTFEFNVSHPPSIHTNHLSKYYLLDTIFHETFDHYLMYTYTHSGCACALHAGARCKQINRKHCLLIETAHDKN